MELSEIPSLLGRAVANLSDGFMLVEGIPSGPDGRKIIFVNHAFTRITGFSAEEAVGRTPDLTVGPETSRETMRALNRAREVLDSIRVEILKYRKDGTTFWAEMDLTPVFDDARNFTHYCCVMRDVTERRAAAMRRMETERLASIGTLAAGVAHEMNNPLAYALMNLAFIEEELPALVASAADPAAERWKELATTMAEVRHGVARVAEIVRDVRAFSRLDTMPAGRCRIPVLVERAVQMARSGMPACPRIATHYDETAEVNGDPGRLSQVFLNLLLNALDSIPPEQARSRGVDIHAFNDGTDVVVEIHDEGVGIAPDVLPRIFDPFFTTKETGRGTGLGLSISYGIVRGIGGMMTVQSKLGTGTIVRVALPSSAAASPCSAEPHVDDANLVPPAVRLRIMVIDDEPLIGRALKRAFSRQDDVAVCQSAFDALDLLEQARDYHLILCDLSMPGMTGAMFYEQIAQRWPDLKSRFVIMTGGASTHAAREFLDGGVVPKLDKPLDLEAVRSILDRVRASITDPIPT